MPLVSVIIPAYNAGPTIERTIRSVQRQTLTDIEIIVIDDGSTDDTVARVAAIDDARVTLRSYDNGGLPTARNRGITLAGGEYLAFLDADDLWSRTKLASHVAIMARRHEIGAVYSWTCTIDDHDRVLGRQHSAAWEGDVYSQLLRGFFIGNASNAVIRRRAADDVGPFDIGLARGEDWEFVVRLASRWPFAVVPRYEVFYRWRTGSISCDVDAMRDGLLIACDRIFEDAPRELQSLKDTSLANIHVYLARSYLTRAEGPNVAAKAAQSLRQAVTQSPSVLLDVTAVRLIARWLIAATLSAETASAVSDWYHSSLGDRGPRVDPWA